MWEARLGPMVSAVCETQGELVDNGYAPSDVWMRLSDGTFLPNAFIATGHDGWTPGFPVCDDAAADADPGYDTFSRMRAAENARTFADSMNTFPADCTYFVSLALWDGGQLQQSEEWTKDSPDPSLWASSPYYPGPTRAAVNANDFTTYMSNSGRAVVSEVTWSDNTAGGAMLGDVIAYDWDNGADGVMDHVAIVTGFTDDGYPLVSQHTPNQLDRFWSWSENAGNWIEYAYPGSKAYLIHING